MRVGDLSGAKLFAERGMSDGRKLFSSLVLEASHSASQPLARFSDVSSDPGVGEIGACEAACILFCCRCIHGR